MKRFSLSILFVLAFGRTALATTFYVSPSGSDSNSCTAAQNVNTPMQTINHLANALCVQPGDTIYLRAGSYPENNAIYFGKDPFPIPPNPQPFPNGIDPTHRTTMATYPADLPARAVITSSDFPSLAITGNNILWDNIDVDGTNQPQDSFPTTESGGTYITIQNSDIFNCPTTCSSVSDGSSGALAHVLYYNVRWHNSGNNWTSSSPGSHAIYGNATNSTSVDIVFDHIEVYNNTSNEFSNAVQAPYAYACDPNCQSADWTFRNSSFHDNTWAFVASGATSGSPVKIYNNVFYNNGQSTSASPGCALTLGYNTTSGFQVYNNTFYNNMCAGWPTGGYAIAYPGYGNPSNIDIQNNIFFGNGTNDTIDPALMSTPGFRASTNLAAIDPLFNNAVGNDFHLKSGSPAIGAGADLSTIFTTDKDGTVRTVPWTIGAFSGQGGGPIPPTITTVSLPNGVVGTAYTATMTATGGTPPYTWTASGLPAGLNMSSGGTITGTPSATGTSQVTVTVTDSMAQSATKQLSLMVSTTATTLTMSVASGPCTLAGTLTISPVLTNWSFPGVTVSTNSAPATCTVRIHDNSPTNPAPDVVSAPFTVTADGTIVPTLQFTQQPTNTVSGSPFSPPVAGTRQ